MSAILKKLENISSGRGTNNLFKDNKTANKVSTALWVAQEAYDLFVKAKGIYDAKTTYTVIVNEKDSIFCKAQDWLMDQSPPSAQKNLTAVTQKFYVDAVGEEVAYDPFEGMLEVNGRNITAKSRVITALNSGFSNEVSISGYRVFAQINASESSFDPSISPMERSRTARASGYSSSAKIVFTMRSREAQKAVIDFLNTLVDTESKPVPALYVADAWGSWRRSDAPQRSIESVITSDHIKESVLEDLRKFLTNEDKYNELGMPYHRGYLFHGPAGTGKTSLIKAIASEMGLDLWYMNLGDMKEDSSMIDLIRSINPRGILLLEDVDSFTASNSREEKEESDAGEGISTSALLNALDGVVTPHGLITIMTTNHYDKLDPALTRSGRSDMTVELGHPSWREVEALWNLFFPETKFDIVEPADFKSYGVSQANITEVFKSNWEDSDLAAFALGKFLGERIKEMDSISS